MVDYEFYQGESLNIPIKPKIVNPETNEEKYIPVGDVVKIEFAFGNILKTYPSEDVTVKDDAFIVHISREDTLSIPLGVIKHIQADVYFKDGNNKPTECKTFCMKHNHLVGGDGYA